MHTHSLAEDVPRAITNVLSTYNWRDRKQLIDTVFSDDVHFWHLFHHCKNKRELFGVYQMWGEVASVFGCKQSFWPPSLRLYRLQVLIISGLAFATSE